jgi:glyoxylase-like metal-dependent hydrolase (beta-lactamase superfamily II)
MSLIRQPMTRRSLTRGLMSLPLIGAAPALMPAHAHARADAPAAVVPLAQVALGRFTVSFLTDGHAEMPFEYFTGVAPEAVGEAAAAGFAARDGALRLAFTQYLIDDGERLILVDAGPDGLVGQSGRLRSGLAALGVAPEEIDAVIVTHAHVDHMAGLISGGRRVFPNAAVHLDRRDIRHFTDPARRSAAPGFLHSSFDATADLIRLYPDLERIEGAREILPGITTVDLSGHTPGQIGVRIEDGGQSLILASDVLFHPSVHPARADIGFVFEQDPAAALAMRERFFADAEAEGALIAATHMPFPGLGRIAREGGSRRWVPADWAFGL